MRQPFSFVLFVSSVLETKQNFLSLLEQSLYPIDGLPED
jgi:hypothetical protein